MVKLTRLSDFLTVAFTCYLILLFGTMISEYMSNTNTTPALKACAIGYKNARGNGNYICVDFTQPNTAKRLSLVSPSGTVLYQTWVAHGTGSGTGHYATVFSNKDGSLASSLGVYTIAEPWLHKGTRAYRLNGIDGSLNNNAYTRYIEIHEAKYAVNGGHSWGCFAVTADARDHLFQTIKKGSILIAYHPYMFGKSLYVKK